MCISNLKWYQPSEETTVVKRYGLLKSKLTLVSNFNRNTTNLIYSLILFV